MSDRQPEALQVAALIEAGCLPNKHQHAAFIRRLHALNEELVEALNLALDFLEHSTEFRIGHPGFERAQAIAKAALSKAKES
jgi:hypothetical protein